MIRGTTPTLKFTLPSDFDCSTITLLNVAFYQNNKVIFDRSLSTCTISGQVISLTLTENETLLMDCTQKCIGDIPMVEIQLRVGCTNSRLASNIIKVPVGRILKEGVLG